MFVAQVFGGAIVLQNSTYKMQNKYLIWKQIMK